MKDYVYISLRDDDKIVKFSIGDDGRLYDRVDFPLAGGPGPMVVTRRKSMFVGLRKSAELACLHMGGNGSLTLASKIALSSDPCFLETDSDGRYVFSAYYGAGALSVHSWNEAGRKFCELQRLTTEPKAHSIRLDRSNRYVFAPHTQPNKVYLYTLRDGALNPRKHAWLAPRERLEPRHACFHPKLPCLYLLGECSSALSVYHFDEHTGGLAWRQTISTLPADGCVQNLGAEVRVSPDGRFVYASNRGHNSIACFMADPTDGKLHMVGHIPAPDCPRSFDLSPDGKHLYIAGETSGILMAYILDGKSGMEEALLQTFRVGETPMWVMGVSA